MQIKNLKRAFGAWHQKNVRNLQKKNFKSV